MKGKTKSGFEYEIPEENFDMEFLDALAEVDENPTILSKVINLIFAGTDGKKRLYDHVRTENGKVPPEAVTREISEIFANLPKNS